jgi:NADPH2:quinone reductase
MQQKKIVIRKTGGPEQLCLEEAEVRQPKPHEVVIHIQFAGVSFADVLMREGVYIGMPRLPFTPGYDIVGTVIEIGAQCCRFQPGQMVAALTKTGGYAEYITLPEHELIPVPDTVDPGQAVALILNYITAWQMLTRHITIHPGQSALIHGAAGGVGTALLQLGKLCGLTMFGTASKGKAQLIREFGATPIDYQNQDVMSEMRALKPDGVDFVFDGIGATARQSYQTLNKHGHLILYGISSMLNAGRKNLRAQAETYWTFRIFLRNFLPAGKRVSLYQITAYKKKHPEWFAADLLKLFALLSEAKIEPVIQTILPLSEAAHAHTLLHESKVRGKIILDCRNI